jgi:hypothetical protein
METLGRAERSRRSHGVGLGASRSSNVVVSGLTADVPARDYMRERWWDPPIVNGKP